MNELVQLEQELGLGEEEGHPDINEMAMRLQAIRPEWPWKEDIDPSVLGNDRPSITSIDEAGIYNRAVIMMAEKSWFTHGLEKELRDLSQFPEAKYANTVLGRWLSDDTTPSSDASMAAETLIEVLPMNSEQRQAVAVALTQPITVITGPPGTGKSQVVTNLLVNAAYSGKRVLFASKNNQAVDVVETRVNALGSRPILLRVGAQKAYQARLAEYVLNLLSSTTTATEKEDFADKKGNQDRLLAERKRLSEEVNKLVQLRNDVDFRERETEEARQHLGEKIFAKAPNLNLDQIRSSLEEFSAAIVRADKNRAGLLTQLLWPLFRKNRLNKFASSIRSADAAFKAVNVEGPPPLSDEDVSKAESNLKQAFFNLTELEKVVAYRRALEELQAAQSLEEIARKEADLLGRIAQHSEKLWKLWLRLQPSMLSADERKKLGKYTALLKMVIEAGEDGQLEWQIRGQYSSMLQDISHLLPCWAVTSLSARGRIPLEPGDFDLVIFDEASQCDIASALPLLYRAKSVVIIGDPNQLSHISRLRRGQDQALLKRHNLLEEFPHWSYSHQSLFALGSTQVAGESIVSLVDHHRSHADIINFSNEEFYEERLRVATRYDNLQSPNRDEPGIRWVDVKGNVVRPETGGAVNLDEAKIVVKTLRDLILTKGYKGTVGVVTPFRAQADAITQTVHRDDKLASALMRQGFLTDTVHKFQGDERDVMIFSPVVSSGLPNRALGFLRSNGKLFNVAITRARAQLIVVGDAAACGACDVGYLSRFATYTASLEGQRQDGIEAQLEKFGPNYPKVTKPELVSDWEKQFYIAAHKAGFRLIPQYNIEKYIVDFLMVEGERKLVIEIDGERYHRNWTGELCRRDQIRNHRLFELGYDVMRFWVYEVRDDLGRCFRRLEQWRHEPNADASS